jgi:hypothetical protein
MQDVCPVVVSYSHLPIEKNDSLELQVQILSNFAAFVEGK